MQIRIYQISGLITIHCDKLAVYDIITLHILPGDYGRSDRVGKSLKGKELGKGISQRKDGRYQARFINRFGKRETIYAKTMTEITKALRDAQYEDEKKLNIVSPTTTLDEWFDIWITTCKVNCRDTSIQTYRTNYNRLRKDLGWRTLSSLNKITIQQAINNLKTDSSRLNSFITLHDMLECATDAEFLAKNPAVNIKTKITKEQTEERKILTLDEESKLLSVINKNTTTYRIVVFALNTGMRIGEIIGLCWDCVDFDKNIIHVKRNLCFVREKGSVSYQLHQPKTAKGIRDIPLTKKAREILLLQKQHLETLNCYYAPTPGFEDLVFTSKTNSPMQGRVVNQTFEYHIKKAAKAYPEINFGHLTMHCLRHTFASRCIANGMKPKVLQKILGHAKLATTMDLYCHVEGDLVKDEMGIFLDMA